MGLAWTEQMSVGNAMIDSEHQKLMTLVNDVKHALERGEAAALAVAFDQLLDTARDHFLDEERIARAANVPIDNHQRSHQYLLEELRHIRDELEDRCGAWSRGAIEHFSHFLGDWLIQHVIGEDGQLRAALRAHPRDFTGF